MTIAEAEEFLQRIAQRKLESAEAEMIRDECLAVIKELIKQLKDCNESAQLLSGGHEQDRGSD